MSLFKTISSLLSNKGTSIPLVQQIQNVSNVSGPRYNEIKMPERMEHVPQSLYNPDKA